MEYAQRRPKLISFGGWLLLAIISLLMIISSLFRPVHALTLSSARDCDDNAVLRCGALTTAELQDKYHGTGVVGIFNRFGIDSSDISSSGTTAVSGQVTRSGQVFIDNQMSGCGTFNNRLVATNAITAGRQNMPGSTKVMAGGVAFYERPPSVSFASSPLTAFVFMKNCQFSSAILASCGNPVRATPVTRPVAPSTQSPQPAPAPTPPPQVKQQVTPTPVTSTTPAPAPTPTPSKGAIANTGPAQVVGLGILASVAGTAGHYLYLRRKSV